MRYGDRYIYIYIYIYIYTYITAREIKVSLEWQFYACGNPSFKHFLTINVSLINLVVNFNHRAYSKKGKIILLKLE